MSLQWSQYRILPIFFFNDYNTFSFLSDVLHSKDKDTMQVACTLFTLTAILYAGAEHLASQYGVQICLFSTCEIFHYLHCSAAN